MQKPDRWIGKFALVLFLIGATFHVRHLLIEWRFLSGATKLGIQTSPFFAELQVFFIVAFLVSSAGLLIHGRVGILISLVGLVAVFLGYIAWRGFTVRQLRLTSDDRFFSLHPELVPQRTFGLIGAHWWDVVIFGGCLILFAWEVSLLRKRCLEVTRGE